MRRILPSSDWDKQKHRDDRNSIYWMPNRMYPVPPWDLYSWPNRVFGIDRYRIIADYRMYIPCWSDTGHSRSYRRPPNFRIISAHVWNYWGIPVMGPTSRHSSALNASSLTAPKIRPRRAAGLFKVFTHSPTRPVSRSWFVTTVSFFSFCADPY